jgi:hypothetical protein
LFSFPFSWKSKRKIEKEEGISVKPSYKKSISLYVMITKLRASLFFSFFGAPLSLKIQDF